MRLINRAQSCRSKQLSFWLGQRGAPRRPPCDAAKVPDRSATADPRCSPFGLGLGV